VQGRSVEAAAGHAHGAANPHFWLDPGNAEIVGAAIAEALLRVAPDQQEKILAAHERFVARLHQRMAVWDVALAPYRGAPLIAFHNSWPYFARHFRLEIVDVIEPKEGVAPSASRIVRLAVLMRERHVRAILHEPFEPDDASRLLAQRTCAALLKLAPSVGTLPEAGDYFALFDHDVATLAQALGAPGG
jgi:ABC-type Zn uptake system ZnuABC Zn-binding protein ZnuA